MVWEKQYEAGCDRSSITLDGSKLYVPTGWWYAGEDSEFLIGDGRHTGELEKKRIQVRLKAHNRIVSLNGRYAFLGTEMKITMFDTRDDGIIQQIEDVGEKSVFLTRSIVTTPLLMYAWGFLCGGFEGGKSLASSPGWG